MSWARQMKPDRSRERSSASSVGVYFPNGFVIGPIALNVFKKTKIKHFEGCTPRCKRPEGRRAPREQRTPKC